MTIRITTILMILSAILMACSTSPTGRKRLSFLPESQMNAMGETAFQQIKTQTPSDTDPKMVNYIKCITDPITQTDEVRNNVKVDHWDVVVFKEDQTVNAFALPGGKIGVYTGIFQVAKNDAQLATVLAHEIGHVVAEHGAERASEQLAAQGGLGLVEAFLGGTASPQTNQLIIGALGVGTQVGILLPFSRTQENEADILGQQLMAQAGFNPQESVTLWNNMLAATKGKEPPAFLSDHPATEARVKTLQEHLPETMQMYNQARAAGHRPQCGVPPR